MKNEYYIAVRGKRDPRYQYEEGSEFYDSQTFSPVKSLTEILIKEYVPPYDEYYPVIRIAKIRIEEIND